MGLFYSRKVEFFGIFGRWFDKKKVMEDAAEMAKQESPAEEATYVVKEKHVKAVLESMGLAQLLS